MVRKSSEGPWLLELQKPTEKKLKRRRIQSVSRKRSLERFRASVDIHEAIIIIIISVY